MSPAITGLDYRELIRESGVSVVRNVLARAAETGLPAPHDPHVAFETGYPGVVLSERSRAGWPENLAISLHPEMAADLLVDDMGFSATVSLNLIRERVFVPWTALRGYHDRAVGFLGFPIGAPAGGPVEIMAPTEPAQPARRFSVVPKEPA